MERDAQEIAWEKCVKANVVDNGHDTEGQGSPITRIVLEFHAKKYEELLHQRRLRATDKEKPVE